MYGRAAHKSMYVDSLLDDACIFTNLWDASALALDQWDLNNRKPTLDQLMWVGRLKVFATLYFDGDVQKATYLLKDVFNYRKWVAIKGSYQTVDYSQMVETSNGTELQREVACSGGACEI
jgi:hypothetical protein